MGAIRAGRNDADAMMTPGTFAALTRKLKYIADMGFTCLQLLPHTEFGGQWGYNPRLMHSVHGPYGTPEDFAALVDAAHARGIAVFVDLALHHGAANGNSLWEYDGWCGPRSLRYVSRPKEKKVGKIKKQLKKRKRVFALLV